MQRQLYAALSIALISGAAWSHGPLSIHHPNPYRINGNSDNSNSFINPYPPQPYNNHYYGRFNDNPSVSPLYRHHHESPYSAHHPHGIGSPYTPYSTPNPYGTYRNPYAPDLFNSPYDPSTPYNPGNIASPYGVYSRPYPINSQQFYNSHRNFINNPYSPNSTLPLYGPYDNPYPQNWHRNR